VSFGVFVWINLRKKVTFEIEEHLKIYFSNTNFAIKALSDAVMMKIKVPSN
jgi:hypothetical protein